MSETLWIKASASSGDAQCVEMRQRDGMVEVRDSKDPEGAILRFTSAEWSAWLDGARSGEFDHLV